MLKKAAVPLLLFALVCWVVYIAGLASSQASCTDGTTGAASPLRGLPNQLNTFGLNSVHGFSANVLPCSTVFRFFWFIAAWEFVVVLAALITTPMRAGLHITRPFWVGMFAISTVLFMLASDAFLSGVSAVDGVNNSAVRRMQTTAAGAILTTVANVFLLLAIGTEWERHTGDNAPGLGHRKRGVAGQHDQIAVPTTGATAV